MKAALNEGIKGEYSPSFDLTVRKTRGIFGKYVRETFSVCFDEKLVKSGE